MNQKWSFYTKYMLLVFLVLQLFSIPVYARASDVQPIQTQLSKLIYDLEKNSNSKGIQVGLKVYNLSKEEPLFSYQEKKVFVPASTFKLLVSTAILDQLSPAYQFKTELYIDGKVSSGGILNGDLILKGYGDPSLTVDDLNQMVQQLKNEQGIKEINGNILVDETYFDDVRLGQAWMWDDEPWYYSAQLSAIGLNRNSVDISVSSDQKAFGQAPIVQMLPENTYIKLVNEATVQEGNEDNIDMDRPRLKNKIHIKGTIGHQAKPVKESLSVEDPALFAAQVLKQQLQESGILLSPKVETKKSASLHLLPVITHYSKPLSDLILHLNKESDNFYAEMFLKTLGAEKKGMGSFSAGLEVVSHVLKKAGIDQLYRQVDGSGLSRLNLITPEQMMKLLIYAKNQTYGSILEQSLSIAGVDGTLKTRMAGTAAEKNLHAKTGSMSGVNNMAGYIQAANGDQLAFSLFLNGIYKSKYSRDFQDQVGIVLASFPDSVKPEGYQEPQEETYPLTKAMDPILDQEELQSSTIGLLVESLEDGKILYAKNPNKLLTPASSVKIWPTMSSILQFGLEERFKTELYATSTKPSGAILQGDLILKGYGDPSFDMEDIDKLVSAVKDLQIKQIQGNLIVDDQEFDQYPYPLGWTWDQESDGRYAQINALSVNEGSVKVQYEPGDHVGDKVKITLLPQTSYVQIINESITSDPASSPSLKVERVRGTNNIHIMGKLPIRAEKGERSISVEDPALYTGTLFKEKLLAAGISFHPNSQVIKGSLPKTAFKIKELASRQVIEILSHMNSNDDHYYAEMILKKLGSTLPDHGHHAIGSTSSGVDVIYNQLKEMSMDTAFDLYDGSGVTRYNQVSASQLNQTLAAMSSYDSFYQALPSIPWESEPKAKIRGIASSVPGVYSWTGYVTNLKGDTFAVSLLINGITENEEVWKETHEKLISQLIHYDKLKINP